MTPPTLTLPPAAETLWQAIGETVREELRSISDGHTLYAIGDGSIHTRNGAIEVTTATNVRGEETIRIEPNNAQRHFEATGLSAHLQPKGPGAKALLDYARTACRQRRDRVVFEADADGVKAWRTATAGMNLTPGNAAD